VAIRANVPSQVVLSCAIISPHPQNRGITALMSSSSTIDASSPNQSLLERMSNLRLPSPAVTVALLMACVFLLRLPSALVPRELNPDESLMLSQAMKFLVDPRPWLAGDTGNAGPLCSYLISVFLLMGFKAGFVLVHMLGSVLICLQILTAYLTLGKLGSEKAAAVGAFMMVLFYGLATHTNYLHYSTELLPNLLLMVGFYIFLVWLEPPLRSAGVSLCLLFSGALLLGTAPWCKLQAAPMTGALGLVWFAAVFRDRGPSLNFSWRVKELIAFCVGAVLPTCVMLAILTQTGAIEDFWHSYIRSALAYAGPPSATGYIENFLLLFLVGPIRQPLLFALLVVGLLLRAFRAGDILLLFKNRKWACVGLLAYLGAALFAACRPRYPIGTYAMWLVPPMTYLAAGPLRALPEIADLRKNRSSRHWVIFGLVLLLLFAAIDGARYVNMVRAIRQLSHSQQERNPRIAKDVLPTPGTYSDGRMSNVKHLLARLTAPCNWAAGDSNDRIAAVVRDIQKTHSVRSLAIWGWAPGVYVLTGIPTSTRYPIAPVGVKDAPTQKYYWARFLGDLRERTPDLFIDAVAPDAFMWRDWTENDSYESDPQLRKFIEDNYILVDELRLVKGAKPIRFFARQEPTMSSSP
jgi:hypothetical protein